MILHIFNPEHDLALAANLSNFTAPHAGRKLRADLGYIPAFWAGADDCILVENVEQAKKAYGRVRSRVGGGERHFIDKDQLKGMSFSGVDPWGWDLAIQRFLLRYGVDAVPSVSEITAIRDLSHRRYAAQLLSQLQFEGTIGSSSQVDNEESVIQLLREHQQIVVKAPWSSSGRGVRFISSEINDHLLGWIRHVISQQGSVMVEPYYNKIKDFGMEFFSDGEGRVNYQGLSLFHTKNGAYIGNVIATEAEKTAILNRYIPESLLRTVKEIISEEFGKICRNRYHGPFGIDMMIVSTEDKKGFLLHPCVEINLRRTMGHVALGIPTMADGFPRVMQITLTDRYKLRIRKQ